MTQHKFVQFRLISNKLLITLCSNNIIRQTAIVKLQLKSLLFDLPFQGWCMCQKDSSSGWLPLSYLRRGSFIREEDVLGFLCSEFATGVGGVE